MIVFPVWKKKLINKNSPCDENETSKTTSEHGVASECIFESCDDSTSHFVEDEERTHGDYDENKNENNFARTLRSFEDEVEYLLSTKKCAHVLTGKINNWPIEHRFSLNRNAGGHHLASDVSKFSNNERTLLLRLVYDTCANIDGSNKKILHESFFEDAHSIINQSKRVAIISWKEK